MTYKQEPCPLCGRDMTAIETHPGRGELYCGHCDLTIGGNDAKTPEELIALMDSSEHRRLKAENAKLRELATYALKHIIEFECEVPDREMLRGKPCEDCADYGSSDCPKCMPRMFDVSGIEVDE